MDILTLLYLFNVYRDATLFGDWAQRRHFKSKDIGQFIKKINDFIMDKDIRTFCQ